MIYCLVWWVLRALFRLVFRWQVVGSERVPAHGALLLASNHVSHLDPPVVAVGMRRPAAFMAKEELFSHRALGWFFRQLNAFPVRRGEADRAALRHSFQVLEEGGALVLFPEGTRSEDGEFKAPEPGIGLLAYRSGAPVVPVYIHGTRDALPRGGGLRLARFSVTYGDPISFRLPEGQKPRPDDYAAAARQIMSAIADLKEQTLRGKRE